jgi:DNA (cytosine-5)-methyltransferase 1
LTTFGSVCSGIEAMSVASAAHGYRAAWLAEIEAFPAAVLAHHHPTVPNLGDMTRIAAQVLAGRVDAPDVLVGGTPCQAFSVAGMRAGMADPRGLLTIRFVELADAIDHVRARRGEPECVVWWENVPGVLSDKDNAFGCFLAALVGESDPLVPAGDRWTDAGCVYGPTRAVTWRVLDAQYFGLAQRRRRVFVVASARAGFDPAAVLFESDGLRRDSAPRRETREGPAPDPAAGLGGGGDRRAADLPALARCLTTGEAKRQDWETCIIPVPNGGGQVAVAFGGQMSTPQVDFDLSQTLQAKNPQAVATAMAVRRLTPTECERLQGFPDDYTAIPWRGKPAGECPDGPRYKALGNSMAVPVMAWIARRLAIALEAA